MTIDPSIKASILVVEDSPTQREMLRHMLEEHGYGVRTAAQGAEALAAIAAERPITVLTDILMPVMDGYELCRKIKSDENLKDIPVILLTALDDPKDVIAGLECGADNFIIKPFDRDYLLSRIEYIISNSKLRDQDRFDMGVEILFAGGRYFINSDRRQILDLLLSTYEGAVRKSNELALAEKALKAANASLEAKVLERTAELEREIDERKKAEESLRETVGELEAFSYSLSHDMRAPLRAMMSFSQILSMEYSSHLPGQGKELLQRITNAARRLDQLIQDVLTYSRLLRTEITLEPISLDTLLEQIIPERPNLHQADIQVRRPLASVMAHPAALTQCITNLLDNAVKFSKPDQQPEIRIWTEPTDGYIRIVIEDNGIGIPPKYQARIFALFERINTAQQGDGTGIGLTIVRKAVERMGGRLGVESELGQGSRFWIELRKAKSNEMHSPGRG
jgi:two-component system, sensor histidine kinase and response regulator